MFIVLAICLTDDLQCKTCPVGYYCNAGTAAPQYCPPGSFSPLPGQKALADCRFV